MIKLAFGVAGCIISTALIAQDVCSSPRTSEIEKCLSNKVENETKILDSLILELKESSFSELHSEFDVVQSGWDKHVEADCKFFGRSAGGSASSSRELACRLSKVSARIAEFEALLENAP
jgi:uncharacterized protein YecT (DUF1311 family)